MGAGNCLVQFGCGLSAPAHWRNFDASPTLKLQRLPIVGQFLTRGMVQFPRNVEFGDVVKGLPISDSTCDAVYCSHVLEHLSLNECRQAMKETYRILKPGGTFRGVLPDLEAIIADYVSDISPDASFQFMRSTLLGIENRERGLWRFLRQCLGNSQHLWMWDYKALSQELTAVGFREIRRAEYGDNLSGHFGDIEDRARWRNCLGFECAR